MELTFLGTGSAYNPTLGSTSAYCILGRTLFLIDCGETVFEAMVAHKLLDKIDTIFLAVTHFHSDHIGSIGSMFSYCSNVLNKRIYLYYPTSDICSLLNVTGVPSSMYVYCNSVPSGLPFNIKAIEVKHDPMIKCYGYEIIDTDTTIFYGGDSSEISEDTIKKLKSGKYSHVYQDTTYEYRRPLSAHNSLEELAVQIEPKYRNRITCMHFGSDFTARVSALGFIPAIAH